MERGVDLDSKNKIMEIVNKAGSDEYVTTWDENGIAKSKKKTEIKKGKSAKARGAKFELMVRKELEEKGFVMAKWMNNVDLETKKIIPAKRKFNPWNKAMMLSGGFPDFIAIKKIQYKSYDIIGVESKMNGILSREEKEKCRWYLENGIFSEIWIAKAIKDGRKIKINYEDFIERYGK